MAVRAVETCRSVQDDLLLLLPSRETRRPLRPAGDASSQRFMKPTLSRQTGDSCRYTITRVTSQLDRIFKTGTEPLQPSLEMDNWSLEESQQFILKWGEEITNIPYFKMKAASRRASRSKEEDVKNHSQKVRLERAQQTLSKWTRANLGSRPENSVCPGEDVSAVLQDLRERWKLGRLRNLLPVMDVLMQMALRSPG